MRKPRHEELCEFKSPIWLMTSPLSAPVCSTRTNEVRILLDQMKQALAAQPIAACAQCGGADTEELRPAVVQFRALFNERLGVTTVTDPVMHVMKMVART